MHIVPITLHVVHIGNISSKYSGNSEATASELLEYLEDMFPCYRIVWILNI